MGDARYGRLAIFAGSCGGAPIEVIPPVYRTHH